MHCNSQGLANISKQESELSSYYLIQSTTTKSIPSSHFLNIFLKTSIFFPYLCTEQWNHCHNTAFIISSSIFSVSKASIYCRWKLSNTVRWFLKAWVCHLLVYTNSSNISILSMAMKYFIAPFSNRADMRGRTLVSWTIWTIAK